MQCGINRIGLQNYTRICPAAATLFLMLVVAARFLDLFSCSPAFLSFLSFLPSQLELRRSSVIVRGKKENFVAVEGEFTQFA
jgi:hypothetical protein